MIAEQVLVALDAVLEDNTSCPKLLLPLLHACGLLTSPQTEWGSRMWSDHPGTWISAKTTTDLGPQRADFETETHTGDTGLAESYTLHDENPHHACNRTWSIIGDPFRVAGVLESAGREEARTITYLEAT
jgi:hypothetical protein